MSRSRYSSGSSPSAIIRRGQSRQVTRSTKCSESQLDVGHALGGEGISRRSISPTSAASSPIGGVELVVYACLEQGAGGGHGAGHGDLPRPRGVLPKEGRVGLDKTAYLTHGRADDQSGSRDDAGPGDLSVRPLPLPQDALRWVGPGWGPAPPATRIRAAVLAVREDVVPASRCIVRGREGRRHPPPHAVARGRRRRWCTRRITVTSKQAEWRSNRLQLRNFAFCIRSI